MAGPVCVVTHPVSEPPAGVGQLAATLTGTASTAASATAIATRSGLRWTRACTWSAAIAMATATTGVTSSPAAAALLAPDGPGTSPTTTSGAAATSTGRRRLSARPASTTITTTTATPARAIAVGMFGPVVAANGAPGSTTASTTAAAATAAPTPTGLRSLPGSRAVPSKLTAAATASSGAAASGTVTTARSAATPAARMLSRTANAAATESHTTPTTAVVTVERSASNGSATPRARDGDRRGGDRVAQPAQHRPHQQGGERAEGEPGPAGGVDGAARGQHELDGGVLDRREVVPRRERHVGDGGVADGEDGHREARLARGGDPERGERGREGVRHGREHGDADEGAQPGGQPPHRPGGDLRLDVVAPLRVVALFRGVARAGFFAEPPCFAAR